MLRCLPNVGSEHIQMIQDVHEWCERYGPTLNGSGLAAAHAELEGKLQARRAPDPTPPTPRQTPKQRRKRPHTRRQATQMREVNC